ncbi:hypothetical protein ABTX34_11195 [Streptomyces sp. NPDC096538]|uniref:hypothetical protein n=1 Tax=Streptomyces sp. NPDC096538 TaxID=3155427 RepID=UPI00331C59A2
MSSAPKPTAPEPDELRVRAILRQTGVGPDAIPPRPTERPRDWLDDILDTPAPPPPAPGAPEPSAPPAPRPTTVTKPKKPKKRKGRQRVKAQAAPLGWDHTPRQSLLDAWDGASPRTRWLIHHATAAAAGWPIGLVGWGSNTAAWFAAGNWTAPSAWVLYGLCLCALSLYRRARTWAMPAAWAAAIPISSTTLGVLLYAPTA